jgi:uncharacterized protein with HEPN domain
MISLEERKLLTDIIVAAASIDDYLEGERSFSVYMTSKMRRRAVERELEIIGEAVNNLLKLNPQIPLSYARIVVDLRNRIIHAYDEVNHTIIWKIVIKDIPVLLKEVQDLLAQQ